MRYASLQSFLDSVNGVLTGVQTFWLTHFAYRTQNCFLSYAKWFTFSPYPLALSPSRLSPSCSKIHVIRGSFFAFIRGSSRNRRWQGTVLGRMRTILPFAEGLAHSTKLTLSKSPIELAGLRSVTSVARDVFFTELLWKHYFLPADDHAKKCWRPKTMSAVVRLRAWSTHCRLLHSGDGVKNAFRIKKGWLVMSSSTTLCIWWE